jgi:hypothetical protein
MPTNERIESWSKLLALLSEFSKLAGIALLTGFGMIAFLFPDVAKAKLDKLGLQINAVDIAGVKIVAKETEKASANGFNAAEALTAAEIKLASLTQTGNEAADKSAEYRTINEALTTIRSAKNSLTKQAEAIKETGKVAGLSSDFPSSAWVYVGYYGDDTLLRKASDRVHATQAIGRSNARVTELLLDYDAPVATTRADCTKHDISEMPPPTPGVELEHAIVTASGTPLKVLETLACPAPGNGKTVFARIEVPAERVKFAKLSQLVRM